MTKLTNKMALITKLSIKSILIFLIFNFIVGRELKQIEVNSNSIMLNLEDFEAGNYIVSYKSGKTVLQNIISVK